MEIKFPFEFITKTGTGPFNFPGTYGIDGYYCFDSRKVGGAQYTIEEIKEKIDKGDWIVTEQPEEKPKYIHDAIIRAWLDGEQIQCKDEVGEEWYDIGEIYGCTELPSFYKQLQYRIKPKDPEVKVYFEVSEGGTVHYTYVRHMKLSEADKILDSMSK